MKTRVLMAASESLPFVKSGGLADVIGSLPQELVKKGIEVRVVLPLYGVISTKYFSELTFEKNYPVKYGGLDTLANVYSLTREGVVFYFIQHQLYFERDNLYGYADDGERFGFFQRAVLDLVRNIDYKPQIIHCHDWHCGMIPFLGKTQYGKELTKLKYIYTIHNLAYQGVFPLDALWSCLGVSWQPEYRNLEFENSLNFMKAGIEYADKITTVSPTYAKEIMTSDFGEKLENVIKSRNNDLVGILNGIDMKLWDPANDNGLEKQYTIDDFKKGKTENKAALQERLGLRVSPDILLVGMVSRLTWQKGVYLMIDKMNQIMANDLQLVILGTGEAYAESQFKKMEYDYRRRAVYYYGYNEELAHLIYGGSDLFLMPSLFEPCGISQLISMRYGTLPLVRETGGLKDTVSPYNKFTKEGTGFSFASYNSDEFMHLLNMAIDLYYQNADDFGLLIKNAMECDVSWNGPSEQYRDLYRDLLK